MATKLGQAGKAIGAAVGKAGEAELYSKPNKDFTPASIGLTPSKAIKKAPTTPATKPGLQKSRSGKTGARKAMKKKKNTYENVRKQVFGIK
jgi:hypothetical protein